MGEHRYPHDGFWNISASLFFLLVAAVLFGLIQGSAAGLVLYKLTSVDFFIIALATLRLTRLVVSDKILAFARGWFFDLKDGQTIKPVGGVRRTMAELIECPWCVGLWAALTSLVLYLAGPFAHFLVLVLALSGAAMLAHSFVSALGRIGQK